MSAVESARVPSQSNASRRKRRGGSSIGRTQAIQRVEIAAEFRWQRGFDLDLAFFQRMGEGESARVQEHPLQALLGKRLVPGEIAVLFVAREREPEMRQVYADLVRASGVQLGFEQTQGRVDVGPDPAAIEHCFRGLPAYLLDPHAALAGAGQVFGQR